MRKILFVLLSALLLSNCQSEEKVGNLEITGNVKGLKKGMLFLKQYQDTSLVTLDSISISGDSHFATTVNIKEPEMLYLFLDRGKTNSIDNSLLFFAEPGKINIETNLETFYANAKVSGSANHDQYADYKKVKARYKDKELDYTQKFLDAYRNNKAPNPDDIAKQQQIIKRRYLYTVNFALNNKDKAIGPYIALSEIPDATVKYLDTIAKNMTPANAKSRYGKALLEFVAERKKEQDAIK